MIQADAQLESLLAQAVEKNASDLIMTVDAPAHIRIDGNLTPAHNTTALDSATIDRYITSIMNETQQEKYRFQKELDFSFGFQNIRIRANAYHQKGTPALALRLITSKVKSYEELGLPPIVQRFAKAKQGFVVITGPTGHGKSTTLASIVEDINVNGSGHIITIEDPIEYVFGHGKCLVSQREVGTDTNSFARALKSAVREDPNVVLVGEMRDYETVDTALNLAETGHLVLSTLHTNSAAQTADRLIDMFPPYLQTTARSQFANVLLGIVSQRLIPKTSGGRGLAAEVMLASSSVRSLIREGKTHQLDNVIATSAADGMISLDKVIAEMISKGEISLEEGLTWSNDPKRVKAMLY